MSAEVLRGLGPLHSGWMTLTSDRVGAFADATADWQAIHLDPAAAQAAGFDGPVVHGFLTLSLLSAMSYQVVPDLPGMRASINYGFDRIRFLSPVPVGARVRGRFELSDLDFAPGKLTAHWDVSIEVADQDRPALVAQWITRFDMQAAAETGG